MLEDIGDVDTKSTFLPWQNMAEGKTVQSTGEDTVCPWQEDSYPLFLPFPCPYAHGELSTLPLSGFPWREDSRDEDRDIVLPLRPYLPLMLSV